MNSPRLTSLLCGALFLAAMVMASAQCLDWPGGCPMVSQLGVSDDANSAIGVGPGHTPEDICPSTVNENKELQLDITETFTMIDTSNRLYLRSYYNTNSAASTTEQFWFFDIDNDPITGGGDGVMPTFLDTGPAASQGPKPCSTPGCETALLPILHATGFEFYIHSYGQAAEDFMVFAWNGLAWVQTGRPVGAINVQTAEDNPYNAYIGSNGCRGISYLPKAAVGIGNEAYRIFTRTYSCTECCGDHAGGEAVILLPGMTACIMQICGDCDSNGFVDILDSLRAANYDVGKALLSPADYSNCNVFGTPEPSFQARVTILDSLWIARYVVGRELLQCCAP